MNALSALVQWWGWATPEPGIGRRATVNIRVDGEIDWSLVFKLEIWPTTEMAGRPEHVFVFTAQAPHLLPLAKWRDLAAGVHGTALCAHQGNGDGCISISGDRICFGTFPADGNAGGSFTAPYSLFSEPLTLALNRTEKSFAAADNA